MKIESVIGKSPNPAQKIYNFISDFRNFNNFIPAETVSDWTAEKEECTFRIDLLGKVGMKIDEKEADKMVKIVSDPGISQYNFNLWIQIKELAENDCRIKITIEPKINAVLLGMVKGQLKNFVDSLVQEIEKFEFPS